MSWERELEHRKARLQHLLNQELIRRGVDQNSKETQYIDIEGCDIIDAEYWVVPEKKPFIQTFIPYLALVTGIVAGILLGALL